MVEFLWFNKENRCKNIVDCREITARITSLLETMWGYAIGQSTRVRCSKDKASVHQTPAPPTELNHAPGLSTSKVQVELQYRLGRD